MDIMKKNKDRTVSSRTIMGIAYSGFCRHCVLFLGYSMWSDLSGLTSRIFSFSDDHLFPKQTRDHQRMYGFYV